MDKVYKVSEINERIKNILDNDNILSGVFIRGEISNYKKHSSGHHYFSLKDDGGVISAVLFKFSASKVKFLLDNGMKVVAYGKVSSFVKSGQYQLYVDEIFLDGEGDLNKAFEDLKRKLYNEGLFAPENKKPLPRFPEKIAIVTAKTGAAIKDMLKILQNRYNLCEILIYSVKVQGDGAADEISYAINDINNRNLADVIIIGRGGGSIEDLWAFNDETLAHTIYASNIPIISAVGHEPDFTISDFVADVRASTPSNAAEIVAPDSEKILDFLHKVDITMDNFIKNILKDYKNTQKNLENRLKKPMNYVNDKRMYIDLLVSKMENKNPKFKIIDYRQKLKGLDVCKNYNEKVSKEKQKLLNLMTQIDAFSPIKVLSRGYSYSVDSKNKVIKSAKSLEIGEEFKTKYLDGEVTSKVISIEEK